MIKQKILHSRTFSYFKSVKHVILKVSVNVYLVTFSMAFNCMIRNVNENGEQCVYFVWSGVDSFWEGNEIQPLDDQSFHRAVVCSLDNTAPSTERSSNERKGIKNRSDGCLFSRPRTNTSGESREQIHFQPAWLCRWFSNTWALTVRKL